MHVRLPIVMNSIRCCRRTHNTSSALGISNILDAVIPTHNRGSLISPVLVYLQHLKGCSIVCIKPRQHGSVALATTATFNHSLHTFPPPRVSYVQP